MYNIKLKRGIFVKSMRQKFVLLICLLFSFLVIGCEKIPETPQPGGSVIPTESPVKNSPLQEELLYSEQTRSPEPTGAKIPVAEAEHDKLPSALKKLLLLFLWSRKFLQN